MRVPQVDCLLIELYTLFEVLKHEGHATSLLLDDVGAMILRGDELIEELCLREVGIVCQLLRQVDDRVNCLLRSLLPLSIEELHRCLEEPLGIPDSSYEIVVELILRRHV